MTRCGSCVQDLAVLERARLALVGVADDVLRRRRLRRARAPTWRRSGSRRRPCRAGRRPSAPRSRGRRPRSRRRRRRAPSRSGPRQLAVGVEAVGFAGPVLGRGSSSVGGRAQARSWSAPEIGLWWNGRRRGAVAAAEARASATSTRSPVGRSCSAADGAQGDEGAPPVRGHRAAQVAADLDAVAGGGVRRNGVERRPRPRCGAAGRRARRRGAYEVVGREPAVGAACSALRCWMMLGGR